MCVGGLYAGRGASAEFFKGTGTALSPGLPMMAVQAMFAVLSTRSSRAGILGLPRWPRWAQGHRRDVGSILMHGEQVSMSAFARP